MVDIVLHIGLGKCGSSALQSSLSMKPIQRVKSDKYERIKYVSVNPQGNLLEGKLLYEKALFSPSGYSASCAAGHIKNFSDATFDSIRSKLKLLSNNGKNLIIMSCEGWSGQAEIFAKNNLLEKFGVQASVICYVRNPVDWINSAWWQWGAWSDKDIDSYVSWAINERILKWSIRIDKWKQLDRVKNVTIRVLPKDIVSDFYEFTGMDTTLIPENRNNSSLPGDILRFYQKHNKLRPSGHQSSFDFILSNTLDLDDTFEKTPWVLSQQHVKKILERSEIANQKLMELLDEKSRAICQNDSRWWDPDAFAIKEVSPSQFKEECLSSEQLDKLLLYSFESIRKLYLQNLQLKKSLYKLNRTKK